MKYGDKLDPNFGKLDPFYGKALKWDVLGTNILCKQYSYMKIRHIILFRILSLRLNLLFTKIIYINK